MLTTATPPRAIYSFPDALWSQRYITSRYKGLRLILLYYCTKRLYDILADKHLCYYVRRATYTVMDTRRVSFSQTNGRCNAKPLSNKTNEQLYTVRRSIYSSLCAVVVIITAILIDDDDDESYI